MKIRLVPSQLAFALYFLFFSCALTWKLANVVLYSLILLAAADICAVALRRARAPEGWHSAWPVYLCMCGPLLAILVNQSLMGTLRIKSYDNASVLALCMLLSWMAMRLPLSLLMKLKWAFAVGAVIATLKLALVTQAGINRIGAIDFVPIIAFAELALLLGLFALVAAGWQPLGRLRAGMLAMSFLVAIYGTYISQTRAAWLTLPMFFMLASVGMAARGSRCKSALLSLAIVLVVGAGMSQTQIVQTRVTAVSDDLRMFEHRTNEDTSLGTRFQLWQAAWLLFERSPLVGTGPDGFTPAMRALSKEGVISPLAAAYPHAHNEFLFNMSLYGIWGILGLLALYAGPAIYFFGFLRSADAVIRRTALMGVGLCLGYVAFGVVDVMFMWRISNVFYAMSVAVFLAIILRRRLEGQVATRQCGQS